MSSELKAQGGAISGSVSLSQLHIATQHVKEKQAGGVKKVVKKSSESAKK
jgi:hypothetical protein